MEGVYDLLKMKKGNCAVTVSGSVAYTPREKYFVDALLVNCGDEDRISRFVNTFDQEIVGNFMYVSTKLALIRWLRRTSPSWPRTGSTSTPLLRAPSRQQLWKDRFRKPSSSMGTTCLCRRLPAKWESWSPSRSHRLSLFWFSGGKGCCGAVLFCDTEPRPF
jgi:hypothetical protein